MTQHAAIWVVEDLNQQRLPARTLVAALRQADLDGRLVHFGAEDAPDAWVARARKELPLLILFSVLFDHLLDETLALITHLRAAGVTAHLTLFGPLPALAASELRATCPALDSVLVGEAEVSGVDLAQRLQNGAEGPPLLGRVDRSPAEQENPLPLTVPNLDDYAFPVRDGGLLNYQGMGFATVESSRGCYHHCTFCLPCQFYRQSLERPYRTRSVSNLVEEIQALYARGARLFLFDDEQFLPPGPVRQERVDELEGQLRQRELDIAFTLKCRADDVDLVLFRQLKRMGLIRVYLGVESGCQDALDRLGKGVTVTDNVRALALLDELEIVADFRSLIVYPWSTWETIQTEIQFLDVVRPYLSTCYTFHEVRVYPGTPLARQCGATAVDGDRPWSLPYTLADPRAEAVRYLVHRVFGPQNSPPSLPHRVSAVWFELLLRRRFQPRDELGDSARQMREVVGQSNRQVLDIWREMLVFVREGALGDGDSINEQAAAWAQQVNRFDLQVGEALTQFVTELEDGNG